jgi:hypothetical protein
MLKLTRKGQSTAEYAIVIGLVIAAVMAMQVYVKRGIQAKLKDASDTNVVVTGSDYGVNSVEQYEPQYLSSSAGMVSTRNAIGVTTVSTGGGVKREITGNETSTRTGIQQTSAAAQN